MIRLIKSCLTFLLVFQTLVASSAETDVWEQIDELKQKSSDLLYSNLDSANFFADSALGLIEAPIDTPTYVGLHNLKASIIFRKGAYHSAIEYYLKALKVVESKAEYASQDYASMGGILYNIGSVYYLIDNYELALAYLGKAEKITEGVDSTYHNLARVHNLRGLIFYQEDEQDSSLYFYNKGLELVKNDLQNRESKMLYLNLSSNIALLYSEMDRPEKAIVYFTEGIEYYKEKKEYLNLAWTHCQIAKEYINLGRQSESWNQLKLASEAAEISAALETKRDIATIYLKHYLEFEVHDSIENALDQYMKINDSIVELKIEKNSQEIEAKYQLGKNAAALALSKENSNRLAAENRSQRIALMAAIGLVIVLCLVFFFIYRAYQQRKKIDQMELQIKDSKLDELMSNYESAALGAMLDGQEKERERIAQDLHDRLGGTLAALKLALRKPENKVSPEDLSIVDEAVKEVRSIAHNLSSGLLEKYGLNEALQQLFQSIERSGGITFNIYLHPSVSGLGQNVALELYRMVQEMVSNTLKHANATEINLQTNLVDDTFNLIFEDNGEGFDVQQVKNGIGLINLQKRAENINATLSIDSKPGRGTIVIVELKMKE